MVREFTDGQMGEFMMELGKIIKCMVMVSLLGQMVEDTKENTLKIKSKVKEHSNGLMEENTQEDG